VVTRGLGELPNQGVIPQFWNGEVMPFFPPDAQNSGQGDVSAFVDPSGELIRESKQIIAKRSKKEVHLEFTFAHLLLVRHEFLIGVVEPSECSESLRFVSMCHAGLHLSPIFF
jgi:hypothetical protein